MGHWGRRIVHPGNSESAVKIVLQFCTIKKAKGYMKILLAIDVVVFFF